MAASSVKLYASNGKNNEKTGTSEKCNKLWGQIQKIKSLKDVYDLNQNKKQIIIVTSSAQTWLECIKGIKYHSWYFFEGKDVK